ncbi:vanadium-dependent haloperoxidase [Spirosoma sp. KCTC 42546]|uniref:vanadium-dependent haloperoxidase n=1 Tax=Spirosoma sp. KCTC 42546 TaxID=2520506 RepID=UPI00115A500A|nr:vanadium-dependent haloperoxidase [Spirosoma sp. KCTC 42546]QDK81436.1 vanadium-dependent haloperoxidase [Spirosoma sp. KCTC 42546]
MVKQLVKISICQLWLVWVCGYTAQAQLTATQSLVDPIATSWADITVRVMTKAPKNTPTYGSRAIGYLGLTMYETVVYASPRHRSVIRKLSDTLSLPKPDLRKTYCWELALNAGQAYMHRALYGYTQKMQPIDSLEQAIHQVYASQLNPEVVERSEQFGKAIAAKIYEWSKSDGGHEGYERNFPKEYKRPVGAGLWVPPVIGQSNTKIPMHPTWGQNRTFSHRNSQLPLPKPLAYSTDTTSQYYRYYKEVYDRKISLTEADRAIVMWWGDDPTETCSPPGHSYNLATIAIRNSHVDLVKAAETYARVGMAVADAFTCCWKVKFTYMVERPSSFIKKSILPNTTWFPWLPFFLEPPFPSFYSGHAVQSAATATVLTELYGTSFSFTDNTHAKRPKTIYQAQNPLPVNPNPSTYSDYYPTYTDYTLTYEARHYASFWDAAQECANSRLMGGIHTRYDNEVGLAEGTKIGKNINSLRWH